MTALEEFKKEAAKNFLNSVLIVDDNIDDINISVRGDEKVIDPGDSLDLVSEDKLKSTEAQVFKLSYKEIVNAFSTSEMHCTPYCYKKGSQFPLRVAEKSDVVIIDWLLNGGTAENILKSIIGNSEEKLRLFIIYTSKQQQAIADIEKIEIEGFECFHETGEDIFDYKKSNVMSCRVIVTDKNSVSVSQLPQHLITSYVNFNNSLVGSIVLSAMSSLRNNTYNLFNLYNKNIDEPLLVHYLNLALNKDTADQAFDNVLEYIIGLITSDLKDIVIDNIKKINIKKCIINLLENYNEIYFNDTSYKLKNDLNIGKILSDANNDSKKFIRNLSNNLGEDINKQSVMKSIIRLKADSYCYDEMSFLDCSKKCLEKEKQHQLKFGTIVKDMKQHYLLCVHPICDCERIKDKTNITFLRLSKNDNNFNFVVKDEGIYVHLRVPSKVTNYFSYKEFEASAITKNIQSTGYMFETTKNEKYKWICDLKDSYTQSILHYITTKYSRIGWDQFEWLRKKSN